MVIFFDEKLVNKEEISVIKSWNALRLLKKLGDGKRKSTKDKDRLAGQWMMSIIASTRRVGARLQDLRLSEGHEIV